MYQKMEIKKIQFVVKPFHQQKILHKWHADLHGFANFCKLPVAHTFKVVQSKICMKVVLLSFFKFCFLHVLQKKFWMC